MFSFKRKSVHVCLLFPLKCETDALWHVLQSNPDHTTSEPYTAASSIGVIDGGIGEDGTGGKSSVENILNFDSWLMDSNGIY
jgi:hypothetical protein